MKSRIRTASAVLMVLSLTVSIVVAASPEESERQAVEAMQAGRYADAVRLFEVALASMPGQPRTLYNLACCHSRAGDLESAATRLDEAWAAGLMDLELIRTDPDLEPLRTSRQGRALMKRLSSKEDEIRRLRGRPEFFDAPVLGGLRIVTPDPMEEGRKYPLVVTLHGHGGNPENFVGIFNLSSAPLSAVICAPYGPYAVPLPKGHGYSWYPAPWLFREVLRTGGPLSDREQRRENIERREQGISLSFALAAIEAAKQRYPIDEDQIFLMGHSEGGILAYGLALQHPDLFRGLIVVGARLRNQDVTPQLLAGAAGKLQVQIYHSREDRAIAYEHATAAHKTLSAGGVQSIVIPYRGGHSLTVELVQHVAHWIAAQEESTQAD